MFTGCLPPFAKLAGIRSGSDPMTGLALMLFIGLFAFGAQYFGWSDPHGEIQLSLFAAFVFGIICGYRTKG
jgi:hypothetical protein